MSLSVAMFSTMPSIALRTIALGANSGSNLAIGQTVVHFPHSTQSKAPVSSMMPLTAATVCSLVLAFVPLLSLLRGSGPSARTSSTKSVTDFANLVLSEAFIHSVLSLLESMPMMSKSSLSASTRSCAFLLPDT